MKQGITGQRRLRVLIAPDAFKGCLSAVAVAHALRDGITQNLPSASCRLLPLADGGEGTLRALAAAEPGAEVAVPALGPLGEARLAAFWKPEHGPAVVEMARAAGLSVTRHRDPLRASSFGVGQLLIAALDAGCRDVWITCGGSATVDGGAGLLRALGYALFDAAGAPLTHGGGALADLARIEPPATPRVPDDARLTVLTDVDNPLLGEAGAAAVYGPQKGADAAAVARLEAGLARLADVCAHTFGRDVRHHPGAGAAGGLPVALAALGAKLRPGFAALAERVGLDAALDAADLVLTGEGRVDEQTPRGKTVGGLLARTAARQRPTWIFGGEITPEAEVWCPPHGALVPIADGPRPREWLMANAPTLLTRAAARAARLWALCAQ